LKAEAGDDTSLGVSLPNTLDEAPFIFVLLDEQ
jgi:hypothetical protein